ncbi:DUF956 family protein [Ligilactobacillus sp. WILCCON 0076]|uniref:DUF956 family protein n=1 Tax=Ligilactobacillus ubinensis TaxID=2876789 RepID=A0A9X2FKT8_9LACO|nr:DUF956 family protein [Ligilactobacillus ubinensis]MCP0887387.1 DUF956 family protein [Ligilactobacillus ubinensis]
MIESINSKVDLTIDATSYMGIAQYGKILVGNAGFEFYDDRDSNKYIQIPWEEVDLVIASVMFKGKWIPRYAIQTKRNGIFTFSSKKPKKVLRAIRNYISPDHMVRSMTFFQIIRRGIARRFKKNKK